MKRSRRPSFAVSALIGALLMGAALPALPQSPIPLASGVEFYRLGGSWSFWRDPSGVADLDGALRAPFAAEPDNEPSLGFGGGAAWARVVLAPSLGGTAWYLECAYPPLDLVELYTVRHDVLASVDRAGDTIPSRLHPVRARTYRFLLAPDSEAVTTLYLRMVSEGPVHASFRIWEAGALSRRDLADHLTLGAYFGLMAVMALYGLFFFVSTREISYLYYIGYVVFHALFQAVYLGVAMLYLWPGNAWWTNRALVVFASLAVASSSLFTREFLQGGRFVPGLRRLIDGCLALSVLNCVAVLVVPYAVSVMVTNLTLLVFSGVFVLAGALTLRRGYTPARFYLTAWTVLMVAVFWLALANFGLLPVSGFAANPLQIGSVFEVLFLALAISDRFTHLRRQNVAAERELRESRERELRATEQRLYHDGLTGLPNRVRLVADAPAFVAPALFLLNVDHFKQVNDFYGNKVGDQVLVELKHRIEACPAPRPARLYRLHADEYALVLEGGLPAEACMRHGQELHAACTAEPYEVAGQRIRLNASIGISLQAGALLEQADMALAEARAHGASVRVYDPAMDTMKRYAENLRWVGIIRDALRDDGVFPVFQPIRDNATGRIAKYESLIRIRGEDGKVVSPGAFLDVAKAARLYPELSRRVIRKSLAAFEGTDVDFSVNVNMEDILQEETMAVIRDCLRTHDAKGRVVFEILESEGIHRYDVASSFIEAMKAEGCRIAIDDFGSGYSSFEHILRMKVDFLKLDASLVKNIDHDDQAFAIVETIQRFAERLGLRTIAEYVHSAAVQEVVARLGVHFSQGYHVGEPGPLSLGAR